MGVIRITEKAKLLRAIFDQLHSYFLKEIERILSIKKAGPSLTLPGELPNHP
jgi:hypothetical protein